jgi:molecular chaperone GrpE
MSDPSDRIDEAGSAKPDAVAGVIRILHDAIAAFIREAEAHLDDGRREAATSRVLDEAERASLARALNDLESAKARVERDAKARASELREKIVLDLLPVLDNLDRTIAAAAQSGGEVFGLIEGVRLTLDQFLGILMRFGIERIESKHLPFDPKLHDAISVVTVGTEGWHNKVLDQIEPGYRYGDKLIRPAKVVVGRHE